MCIRGRRAAGPENNNEAICSFHATRLCTCIIVHGYVAMIVQLHEYYCLRVCRAHSYTF